MCGIAGFLDKTGDNNLVGQNLLGMLEALGCRGPDSSGVAIWGAREDDWLLRVKLAEAFCVGDEVQRSRAQAVLRAAESVAEIRDIEMTGNYARLSARGDFDTLELVAAIEDVDNEIEVISCGHALEIVKETGTPAQLEKAFQVSKMRGTHGIGHTRLSTESRIDLSHSQPFGTHGLPDVATVHNGHITNYHRLRRIYEQRGVHFYTENDSEIIGIYLRDRMAQGDSFEQALHASQHDFDGSYCYLAANENQFAYVKDGFGFKPLIVAESRAWVAIATEEIALQTLLKNVSSATVEPPARSLQIWPVAQMALV